MEQIKDTIASVIGNLVAKKQGEVGGGPEGLLKKALTKKELGHIKFNYFKKGVININVDSSSWLYSLNLKKEELLEKLGKESSKIKDIRFRIGEVK